MRGRQSGQICPNNSKSVAAKLAQDSVPNLPKEETKSHQSPRWTRPPTQRSTTTSHRSAWHRQLVRTWHDNGMQVTWTINFQPRATAHRKEEGEKNLESSKNGIGGRRTNVCVERTRKRKKSGALSSSNRGLLCLRPMTCPYFSIRGRKGKVVEAETHFWRRGT